VRNTYAELPYKLVNEEGKGVLVEEGEFSFTLVGDSGTKVQPNGQKARH